MIFACFIIAVLAVVGYVCYLIHLEVQKLNETKRQLDITLEKMKETTKMNTKVVPFQRSVFRKLK